MASLLLRCFSLGFAVAASPGPLFFLCLRRTVTGGWRLGLVSGLGVATADGGYAAVAAFGVAAISTLLVRERRWLTLAGAVALTVVGVRTLMHRPVDNPTPVDVARPGDPVFGGGLLAGYLSTLGLTLANPATIVAFTAVFTSLGVSLQTGGVSPVLIVGGVAAGSTAWWLVVVGSASYLRARFTPSLVRAIGTGAGLAILGLAVLLGVTALTAD